MQVIDNEGMQCVAQPVCASCGAPGRIIHREVRDQLFGAPGTWSMMRCLMPGCGLAWLNPQPLPSELPKLAAGLPSKEEQVANEAGESRQAPKRDRYVSKGAVHLAKEVLRRLVWWRRFWFDTDYVYLGSGTPGRLLDVNCGMGDYLLVAQEAGWTPVGLDIDADAVEVAHENGIEAHVGTFLANPFPDASFDAITMRNVIETLPYPQAVFDEAHRLLKPGGRFVVMTPNVEAYCHYAFGDDWRGLGIPRHLYLYSQTTLRRLAKKAGFGHSEAFSQFRNERGVRFMAAESEVIAERAGRKHWPVYPRTLGRKAGVRAWLGIARGEWVHLVAEK